MSVTLSARDGWAATLDAIEEAVRVSEQLLVADGGVSPAPTSWNAPVGLGPMPADMRERALTILARVAEVERALADTAALTARQLGQVQRVDPRRREQSAGSIDTTC